MLRWYLGWFSANRILLTIDDKHLPLEIGLLSQADFLCVWTQIFRAVVDSLSWQCHDNREFRDCRHAIPPLSTENSKKPLQGQSPPPPRGCDCRQGDGSCDNSSTDCMLSHWGNLRLHNPTSKAKWKSLGCSCCFGSLLVFATGIIYVKRQTILFSYKENPVYKNTQFPMQAESCCNWLTKRWKTNFRFFFVP